MKKIVLLLLFTMIPQMQINAQNTEPTKVKTTVKAEKHISSSILLWMRDDNPRQAGMDRWKGPHAQIIAANKGLLEYRQIHFSENNSGLWPKIDKVETNIPHDRKIDGVADVTLKNLLSVFRGKKQNKLAYADEVNLFKRTILYAAFPNSYWYKLATPETKIEASSMVFLRKKEGVSDKDFKNFINKELTPMLANTGMLTELKNKVYNPWKQKQWNTPNVLHDNEEKDQFQASLMLGFTNKIAMQQFFASEEVKNLSERISNYCSAVHAYEVFETITFIKNGKKVK